MLPSLSDGMKVLFLYSRFFLPIAFVKKGGYGGGGRGGGGKSRDYAS
jgi:hypothetical protein